MNRYAAWTLVATIAGVGTLGLANGASASADTTLNLFERDTVQHSVDLGAPGPGPGDQFIFVGDVFDRPGGLLLGTMGGSCTTLTGNETAGQQACNGAINLNGGQIVIQGVADTAGLFVRGHTVPLSIVGGAGAYQDARGTATLQVAPDVPNQTDAYIVLSLSGAGPASDAVADE